MSEDVKCAFIEYKMSKGESHKCEECRFKDNNQYCEYMQLIFADDSDDEKEDLR